MPFGRAHLRTLVGAVLFLAVAATSCGVEPGYETLDVRYDGVPINLDAAAEASASEPAQDLAVLSTDPAASDAADSSGSSESADGAAEPPDELAYATPAEDPTDTNGETDSRDYGAHRDPEPESVVDSDASDVQAVDSDADTISKNRLRALESFGDLVVEATNLNARDVNCFVSEVAETGVNPIPMNRALRRALDGRGSEPLPRYVALAQSVATACGVTLSESLLR